MRRLGLLLVLFAWIGVGAAVHDATAANTTAVTEVTTVRHIAPTVTSAGNHGFRIRHMPGRGGRRCNDPVIAHGTGACSE
jgi:hypothetical protein